MVFLDMTLKAWEIKEILISSEFKSLCFKGHYLESKKIRTKYKKVVANHFQGLTSKIYF